jgi:arylsulfatase A-like enzyme
MFSGYYPPQVLPPSARARLPEEIETVAERLARAGYRTGAITAGAFVSSQFGVDQGFGYFLEESGELDELLEEARGFLDADDGRPTFLFVQSYRVHWPYRASGALLDSIRDEAHAQGATSVRVQFDMADLPRSPRMEELARQMHAHYLGGVADLDRDLAPFLEHLRASGVLGSGYLVFTSDHGEGFCEHGAFFHARVPFEEQMRVPLLIAGRGLAARRIDRPVSLVDLAPTLADMAGIPAAPDWPGSSLLSGGEGRDAIFGFEASSKHDSALFVLEGEKKILCVPEGTGVRLVGAYDLAQDRREEHDLAATAAWPEELLDRHGAAISALLTPLVQGEAVELDEDKLAELRELGY